MKFPKTINVAIEGEGAENEFLIVGEPAELANIGEDRTVAVYQLVEVGLVVAEPAYISKGKK